MYFKDFFHWIKYHERFLKFRFHESMNIGTIPATYEIPFTEYDLDNGLHVILSPSHNVPLVVTNLWYHVGAKDDPPARTGFAHLFEHMMFQGSRNVGKAEHLKYVQRAGGNLNASTNLDRTNYFQTLPASQLELALWLESDRMLSLNVTSENFENQRQVVKEERRQNYDNRPYGTVWENIVRRLWPAGTYHTTTIGSMDDLDQASIEDVLQFHQEYYKPNNCSLALVGDFEEVQARRLIEQYFAPIPRQAPVNRTRYEVFPVTAPVHFTMEDSVKLPGISIAFQGGEGYGREGFARELIAFCLDNARSSRMYRELVYRRKLAREVDAMTSRLEKGSALMFECKLHPTSSMEEAEEAMWGEIEKLRAEPMSEQELTKLKNRAEMWVLSSRIPLGSRADQLQCWWCFRHDTSHLNRNPEMYRSITAEEIHQVANKYLDRERSVVCHVLPK